MSEESRKQMVDDHWDFIEGIINILLKLGKFLFKAGMKHGLKHRDQGK